MKSIITEEMLKVISEMTELRSKAMALDTGIAKELLPRAKEMAEQGHLEELHDMIIQMPACNTRMKLAGLIAHYQSIAD